MATQHIKKTNKRRFTMPKSKKQNNECAKTNKRTNKANGKRKEEKQETGFAQQTRSDPTDVRVYASTSMCASGQQC